jgi:hypothetical protein
VNAANTVTASQYPALTVVSGPALTEAFYTPLAVNDVDGARLLIAGTNGLYESFNRGDTIGQISTFAVNTFRGDPLVYGVPGDVNYILAGTGSTLQLRTTASGSFTALASVGGTVVDVAVDPGALTRIFALTTSAVQFSSNSGGLFNAVTGNLISAFSPGSLRSMVFVPGTDDALVVGADRGVYVAFDSTGFSTWQRLGSGLPNAIVFELEYDQTDNLLVAGTMGRGAWTLTPAILVNDVFRNGFE